MIDSSLLHMHCPIYSYKTNIIVSSMGRKLKSCLHSTFCANYCRKEILNRTKRHWYWKSRPTSRLEHQITFLNVNVKTILIPWIGKSTNYSMTSQYQTLNIAKKPSQKHQSINKDIIFVLKNPTFAIIKRILTIKQTRNKKQERLPHNKLTKQTKNTMEKQRSTHVHKQYNNI